MLQNNKSSYPIFPVVLRYRNFISLSLSRRGQGEVGIIQNIQIIFVFHATYRPYGTCFYFFMSATNMSSLTGLVMLCYVIYQLLSL